VDNITGLGPLSPAVGFAVYDGNNTLNLNTANNTDIGFPLEFNSIVSPSNNNFLSGNTADSNALAGFYISDSSFNNTLIGNTADDNT